MRTGLVRAVAVWALVLVGGCAASGVRRCEDGTLCPPETVCSTAGCVPEAQAAACRGLEAGAACALQGGELGRCEGGVCLSSRCGNGRVDPGEVCDDGNTASYDGCRGDCRKEERCGDGVRDGDGALGEACDDGNTNPVDGCDRCAATRWAAHTVVGGAANATLIGLSSPNAVALDRQGNAFIADTGSDLVLRVDRASGVVTAVAGTGLTGDEGDGGPAAAARLHGPRGLAVDGLGNLFIADTSNNRVRKVDHATGLITTVAGSSTVGFSGDGGPAASAQLNQPLGLAVDGLGNVYLSDRINHRVRRIDAATGVIATVAGTGAPTFGGDGGPALLAQLAGPGGLALDPAGDLYIADAGNNRIRVIRGAISGAGIIETVAGAGPAGLAGDGGPATAALLNYPFDVAVDAAGNLFIADLDNHRVRRVAAATGIIATVVGSGCTTLDPGCQPGFGGDGGPATSARLDYPTGLAVEPQGSVLVVDMGNKRIRRADATTGLIATVAGTGTRASVGDGSAALGVVIPVPTAVIVDPLGHLLFTSGPLHRVFRVDKETGLVTSLGGVGTPGSSGDGGPATRAALDTPRALAVDPLGNLYVADAAAHRIRRVDRTTGVITTVAGTGSPGSSGDNGPATGAQLDGPDAVAADGVGRLYIHESQRARVRRLDLATGVITSVVGTGAPGFSGDGGPAATAQVGASLGLAADGQGNLFIADRDLHRIRRVDAGTGVITTVAGSGAAGFMGDGGLATAAQLAYPAAVTVDPAGNLFVADTSNMRLRRVDAASGLITTVAGNGCANGLRSCFSGDGGPAAAADVYSPQSVARDPAGNLFVADQRGHVRRIDAASGVITTVAGQVDPAGLGLASQARAADPRALVAAPPLTFVAGGLSGTVQAIRQDVGRVEVVAGRYLGHYPATRDLARFRDQHFGAVEGVAYDAGASVLYLSETSNHRLHAVQVTELADPGSWTIAALANGAGTAGFVDGAASVARLREPSGLYLEVGTRVLYVADAGNHVVRAVDLSGKESGAKVWTVAGTPETLGFYGDGGPANGALLYGPKAVTGCPNGDLFIADTGNHRVRRVAAGTGLVTTVLGDGVPASSGEGRPARDFPLDEPQGIACDGRGNVYVSSSQTVRLLPSDAAGLVDGTGPVQTIYGAAPRDTFPASVTRCLTGVAVKDEQTVQVADACTGLVVELKLGAAPR